MKQILVLFASIVLLSQFTLAQRTYLGLTHPTPKNIERILYLQEHHLIDIDSLYIIGVFDSSEEELIAKSNDFIKSKGYNNVSITTLNNTPCADSLFYTNACTVAFKALFEKTDGFIFSGGADIPPSIYGEKTFLSTAVTSEGRNWELSFLFHLLGNYKNTAFTPLLEQNKDYPILGICLGMQEMNVATGGTLYQDIPFQIYHKKTYEEVLAMPAEKQHKNYHRFVDNENEDILQFHPIKITPNSLIDFNNNAMLVPSVHHQAAHKLGKNLAVMATSTDKKVVEALYHKQYKNVYGIQFHPELSVLYHGVEFKDSKDSTIVINDKQLEFYKNFWLDFSKRLKQEK